MLNAVGAVLIIGATAAIGLSGLWRLGARVRILAALISALEMAKNEICDRMTPLPELLERLSQETDPPVDLLFHRVQRQMEQIGARSFYLIWKGAVEESSELELTKQEEKSLIDLGRTLGRYDTEEQRRAFDYILKRLEAYLKRAEEERRSSGKVYAVLGFAVGVFVVIILL